MEKVIYFDYCAFILLAILFVSTILRGMTKGKLNRYFFAMLLVCIFSVLADIAAVSLDEAGPGNVNAKYCVHTLYLLLHMSTTPLYILYLVAQTDTWHNLNRSWIQQTLLALPFVLSLAVLAINPFRHIVFYLDETDTYTRGGGMLILYVSAFFYIAFGITYLHYYKSLLRRRHYIVLMSVFPFMLVAAVIQYLFPQIVLEMFANACGLLFISMMIQRPEEIIDVDTGLGNLSAYVTDTKRAFSSSKPVEVILINIKNYNSVKDMLGYDGMNEVLHRLADNLVAFNRRQRIEAELYYLGMGKFRLVIDYRHFDRTEETAVKLNSLLKNEFLFNQMDLNLSTCVCIAKCPEDIGDVDSLLAFGNDLNTKKYTGEVVYARDIYKKEYYDIMKDIDRIIERALAEHRFSVYYQPIYSVREGRFNSAEALLRLMDDKYGFISPDIFIPAAEKSGAIHKIGAYVLDEVCRFITSEEYRSLQLDYIEINLSVVQCMQTDLAKQILNTLKDYRITPDQINLEITETAASYSQKTMLENLSILSEAGISLALDDFGTGYSNMRRIASLPLHLVKLDKSFVDMGENPRLQIVLHNTIRMIKAMDMKIVVEGIETEKLVQQFSDLQCEYIQGYYYSKPIPKEEFIDFIKESIG